MQSRIIQYGREVDDRGQCGDIARIAQILVPDDSFADKFGFLDGRGEGFEEVEGDDAPLELEGELGRVLGCGGGADVVK